jgi:EmrB/QacA subfamily drug resistance transporter
MVAEAAPTRHPYWILVGACAGLFVLMLDSTVVVLALPAIRTDLGASVDGLQWIQNAYLLTLTAAVIASGRLGDIRGRRSVFVAGMVAFAVGSVISGSAGSEAMLIAGRVVQGLGGAALLSLSLALTAHAFPPEQQARALGIWAAISAVALAVGPLIGGLLIEAASWRWIFFINVPITAAGVAILLARGAESRDPTAGRRVDVTGMVVVAAGLTAIVFALVEADEWGWGSARTLGLLGAGAAVLAGFWLLEHRRESPLVDFSLFRNRPYLGASAAAFALVGSYWAVMFFQPQYLQDELGYSAAAAGAMVLPITAPMVVLSPFAGRLIGWLGPRTTMSAGMVFGTAGLVLQALAEDSASYLELLPGFLCFGLALALVYAPMSVAAMAAMPRSKAGIASGVLAMVRVLAGALLLAISSAVFQSVLPDTGAASSARFGSAIADALWAPVAVMVVGTALTWLLVRAPADPGAPASDPVHHQHHHRFHL